ncbi:ABC transporter substrate-binding protein [Scytonema sp. NUACC21]
MSRKTRDRFRFSILIALAISLTIFACDRTPTLESQLRQPSVRLSPTNDKVLKIWWDKGFALEEDEALALVVRNWEKKSGYKAKLSFYGLNELPHKALRSLQAGHPPDIMLSFRADKELNPRFAWEGKLADVSDVIAPVKNLFPESVLEAVHFYNNVQKKRSYYAVPITQTTMHFFYWRDMLKQIGKSETSIPTDWNGFWEFWKQVHNELRTKQKQNLYGLGLLYSIDSADTYIFLEHILEAYDVKIVDEQGKLLIGDPRTRQKIINVLDWYAKFYQQGYVPSDSLRWLNPDNNRSLLNRAVVMTPNMTLSIPSTVSRDRETYNNKLGTLKFPNKPNGQPMRYIVTVGQVVLFANSQNQEIAKNFLTYLIQPEILNQYLKASERGNFPVLKSVWKDPYWTNPKDSHISSLAKTLIQGSTRPLDYVRHPAYSVILDENIWAKALNRIVVDGVSPEQATDEAAAQIQGIFAKWQDRP